MDYKQHTIKLALNPKFKSTIETDLVAWSHDKNSYKFYFELSNTCGEPMILDGAVGRIKLDFLREGKTIIESLGIESENLGLASFTIPDGVLGYEGKVEAHVYLDYESQTHDLGSFSFLMKKSSIDNKLPDLEFYVSEWDEALKKAEELNEQIKDRDLVTRTELAEVEKKKANKESVNKLEQEVSTKATKQETDNKLEKKTNNDTFVAITSDMQRQIESTQSGMLGEFDSEDELKKTHPNGAKGYAIVWFTENSQKVGYTYTYKNNYWSKGNVWNGVGIPKDGVTSDKATPIISTPIILFTGLGARANYDTKTNQIIIPEGGARLKNESFTFSKQTLDATKALETGSYLSLFFNTKTLLFEIYSNSTITKASQHSSILGVLNIPNRIFYGESIDITFDGRLTSNANFGNKQQFNVTGFNDDIFFDWENETINFPSNTNGFSNNEFFGMATLTNSKPLIVKMIENVNVQMLLFNNKTKEIRSQSYSDYQTKILADDIPFALFSKNSKKVIGNLNWSDENKKSIHNNNTIFLGISDYIDFDFENKKVIIPAISNIIIGSEAVSSARITGRVVLEVPMPDDPSRSEYIFVWDNKNDIFEFIAWDDIKLNFTSSKVVIAYTAIAYKKIAMANGTQFKINGLLYDSKEFENMGVNVNNVIPQYFKDEIDRLYEDVVSLKSTDKLVLSHITDIHGMIKHIDNFVEFNNMGLVDIAVNGGDTLNTEKEKQSAVKDFNEYRKSFSRLKCPFYLNRGNHDAYTLTPFDSSVDGMNSLEFSNRMIYSYKQSKLNNVQNDGYYFVDDDIKKIRIIFTNSSNGKTDIFFRWDWDHIQLKWLTDVALNMTGKEDYHVLIFGHHNPLQKFSGSIVPKNGVHLINILKAFKDGLVFENAELSIDVDFKSKHEIIAYVFGHTHQDALDFSVGFPLISTASSLPDYYSTPTGESGVNKSWERDLETVSEDCWDVFIIDTKTKKVKIRRFGAGENREFNY